MSTKAEGAEEQRGTRPRWEKEGGSLSPSWQGSGASGRERKKAAGPLQQGPM